MTGQVSGNSITLQVLKQVENVLPTVFYQSNQVFKEHALEICQVDNLLHDQKSRQIYSLNLSCLAAILIFPDIAKKFSLITEDTWQEQFQQATAFYEQQQTPQLKCADSLEEKQVEIARFKTFCLANYQYQDVVKVEKGEIFLDGGAYVGDTALWAYLQGADKVYSFEPCQENFANLKVNLADHGYAVANAFPVALSKQRHQDKLRIFEHTCARSTLESELDQTYFIDNIYYSKDYQTQEVACVSIDEWAKEQQVNPTFIKLDIEGSEFSAVLGAQETIKRCRPKLAINLSHCYSNIWTIPNFLHKLVPEYKFYCHKTHFIGDCILFAMV